MKKIWILGFVTKALKDHLKTVISTSTYPKKHFLMRTLCANDLGLDIFEHRNIPSEDKLSTKDSPIINVPS